VITGANRGIGLALVRRYMEAGDTVLALCRSVDKADKLAAVAATSGGRVRLGAIDISDQASVDKAAKLAHDPVDILINNAGILGGTDQTLGNINVDEWLNAFKVMAIGPFRVTRAFIPNLARAKGKVLFVSSQAGASTWPYGGYYGYASAKAAGNRIAQVLAIDLRDKGISVASVHPGYVRTDMGGPGADIGPDDSAAGIYQVVANLNLQSSGGFFKWNGEKHPV
jgi:NAD(P)-dependent dehydrogenase (short-subunit alcohol dehydrogenase family)